MICSQILVWLIPLVGTGSTLFIRLEDVPVSSTTRPQEPPTREKIVLKAFQVINDEDDKKTDDFIGRQNKHVSSSYNRLGVIRNGLRKIYRGIDIPVKKIYKGAGGLIGEDYVEENVSDRIDNVEQKVDILSQELNTLETLAGIYFVARIFSGLMYNLIVI